MDCSFMDGSFIGCSCESWPLVYRLNSGFSSNVFYFLGLWFIHLVLD